MCVKKWTLPLLCTLDVIGCEVTKKQTCTKRTCRTSTQFSSPWIYIHQWPSRRQRHKAFNPPNHDTVAQSNWPYRAIKPQQFPPPTMCERWVYNRQFTQCDVTTHFLDDYTIYIEHGVLATANVNKVYLHSICCSLATIQQQGEIVYIAFVRRGFLPSKREKRDNQIV